MTNSGVIEIDGYKLQYRIEGDGPTALVIGSAVFYERTFSKALRQHMRLVFIDWRGFAEPPQSIDEEPLSIDLLLNDIEQVRKQLGIEKCVVIGHSAHAILALEYAKKYKQHVKRVVMIGMSPNLSPELALEADRSWQQTATLERKAALEERIKRLPDDALAALAPQMRFVKWYVRRDPQAWFDFHYDSSKLWDGVFPNMRLFDYLYGVFLRKYDITTSLETFDTPVFLALGRCDFIVAPPSSWDPFRPKFQNLTLRVFERSGHSPHYEEAALFDEELIKWLNK